MRPALVLALAIVAIACTAPAPSPAAPTTPALPTRPPATAGPRLPTPTPQTNYREVAQPLVQPLGALIIAVRNNDAINARDFLAEFNQAANLVQIRLSGDETPKANTIRTAIDAVRASPRDLKVLERERDTLLVIP